MLWSRLCHTAAGAPQRSEAAATARLSPKVAGVGVARPGADPGVRRLPPLAPASPALCAPLTDGAGGSGPGPTLPPPAPAPAAGDMTVTQNVLRNSGGPPGPLQQPRQL